jgi:4-hydroxy-tetrahydrodipicolinate synthase
MQQFTGTYTALVTPFREGAVDERAYARLIDEQVAAGVDGVVAVGTTGESPTLDHEEHVRVIRLAIEAAAGRCRVIAGTGSNCTREAIAMTHEAEELGADAALLVVPYYNKPSQEGLYRHFRAIADSTRLPVILYSVPSRTVVEIGVETTRRLASDCPNVVAIKEAGGSVDRVSQLKAALPPDFTILSGDDVLTLPFLASGASGVISVTSNLLPGEIVRMVGAFRHGKLDVAQTLHHRLYALHKDLFIEPNPVPVKVALALTRDWLLPEVRLPLCEMSGANLAQLRRTLASLELIPR